MESIKNIKSTFLPHLSIKSTKICVCIHILIVDKKVKLFFFFIFLNANNEYCVSKSVL